MSVWHDKTEMAASGDVSRDSLQNPDDESYESCTECNELLEGKEESRFQRLQQGAKCIYIYMFVGALGTGIFLALYSDYATDICGGDTAKGSELGTYIFVGYYGGSTLAAPAFGVLSDSIGRRSCLLFCVVCRMICAFCVASFPSYWAFIAFSSLLGLVNGISPLSYAIVVDFSVKTPASLPGCIIELLPCALRLRKGDGNMKVVDRLTTNFVVLWCWTILGVSIGVGSASYFQSLMGTRWTLSLAGWTLIPAVVFMWLYFEETMPESQLKKLVMSELLTAAAKMLRSVELLASSNYLLTLAFAYFLLIANFAGIFDVVLFWCEYKFEYFELTSHQDELLELITAGAAFGAFFSNTVLFHYLEYRHAIVLLLVWSAMNTLITSFTTSVLVTAICICFSSFSYALTPAMLAIMTPALPHKQQGHLQGSLEGVSCLGLTLGPLSFEYLFYESINSNLSDGSPEALYYLPANAYLWFSAGLFMIVAFIVYFAKNDMMATGGALSKDVPSSARV